MGIDNYMKNISEEILYTCFYFYHEEKVVLVEYFKNKNQLKSYLKDIFQDETDDIIINNKLEDTVFIFEGHIPRINTWVHKKDVKKFNIG